MYVTNVKRRELGSISIEVGDIKITIIDLNYHKVSVGIDAPPNIQIKRIAEANALPPKNAKIIA